ncbi:hypothetical protein JJD41_03820 [Oxynema sp. CENA135]|uniref:hypothetical protein n=1 Tax=Oxynema sp. CENA135 TaxID=984206 RepID=UPI00190C7A08|nr:hypothetical protein [Oxynema sp. CENA135]MBK4729020.1 hypothetical protein [Oxynema sp. CENA135]
MLQEDETIQDFIKLVETQKPLFADCQEELQQLLGNLPSDKEGMSDAIADWCEAHPSVQNALDALSEQKEGDRVPGHTGIAPPPPDPKFYQQMLENAIRRNQSPSNKP